jgi:hypothetical protein
MCEIPMSASTCPFCNALLPASVGVCPRCGESVGTRNLESAGQGGPAKAPELKKKRRWVMVATLLVIAGLGIWAVTANWHRIRSPFGGATPPAQPVVMKPDAMPGLGYLPETTEAVLAIQVQRLLERLGPDAQKEPAKALEALGLPETLAEIVDKASAVGLKNVDQLVIGLGFEKHAFPPEMVIVVHATRPFDLDEIARKSKAHTLKKDGRTLVVAKAGPLPEMYWWKAADRVLVATILAKDFEGVPGLPRTGIDHLPPALRTLIQERVADDSVAWLAAASDRWHRHLAAYTLFPGTQLQGRNDLLKPAERLRTVVMSVPVDEKEQVDVQIGLASADQASELRGKLTERFRGEDVQVSGEQEMCRIQVKNEPANVRSIFGRLVGPAK